MLYLVAPGRVYALLKNAANTIRHSSTTVQEVKSLFSSSDYVLTQLFPIHTSFSASKANTFSKNKAQPFNALNFFTLSSYHNRPLILEIIRDEVNLKKKALQRLRSEQAASLGVLVLTPPQFSKEEQEGEFVTSTASQTRSCIEMIKYVMEPQDEERKNYKNVHHLQQHLNSMSDIHTSSASDVTMELYAVVKNWSSTYNRRLQCIQSSYGRPSFVTRYWIPAVASYFVGNWTVRYGLKRKEDIIQCFEELGKTAHDFILNWVWEPVLKVYETIRLKDQRLGILSKQGLQSDMDVSRRMMLDWILF
jgi:nuclear-control-of-ATPase protein 2